jgi:hypothetical protein
MIIQHQRQREKIFDNCQGHQLNILVLPVTSGMYYKHITIVNENSSVISKWHLSLTDDARVVIYDCR